MWPWIVGLGGGLIVSITQSILSFIIIRSSQQQNERTDQRALELAKRLDTSFEDNAELEKGNAILATNISELKRELADKSGTIAELNARVESVEKARAAFAEVLKQNPGAVTAVVSSAFDELREAVSRAKAVAGATTRDPGRREDDPVHEATDVHPPR